MTSRPERTDGDFGFMRRCLAELCGSRQQKKGSPKAPEGLGGETALLGEQGDVSADCAGDCGDRDEQVEPDFERTIGFLDFHGDVLLE